MKKLLLTYLIVIYFSISCVMEESKIPNVTQVDRVNDNGKDNVNDKENAIVHNSVISTEEVKNDDGTISIIRYIKKDWNIKLQNFVRKVKAIAVFKPSTHPFKFLFLEIEPKKIQEIVKNIQVIDVIEEVDGETDVSYIDGLGDVIIEFFDFKGSIGGFRWYLWKDYNDIIQLRGIILGGGDKTLTKESAKYLQKWLLSKTKLNLPVR